MQPPKKTYLLNNLITTYLLIGLFMMVLSSFKMIGQNDFNYTEFLETTIDVPDDSLALFLYNKALEYSETDSLNIAIVLLDRCNEIVSIQPDSLLWNKCLLQVGKVYNELLEYNNSFTAFQLAWFIAKKLKDTTSMIRSMSGIEKHYYQLDIIDSAIRYCTQAMQINKLQNNYVELADNYRALYSYQRFTTGTVLINSFVLEGLIDSSLSAAIKSGKPEVYCNALTNFGLTLYDSDIEKAFQYMQQARDSARNLPAPSKALVYALAKSSIIYVRAGKFEQAWRFLNEALPLAIQTNYTSQMTHIYYLLGILYHADDSISDALACYTKASALAEKYRYNYYLPDIYRALFNIYKSNMIFDSSFIFQQKYMEMFRKKHDRDMNIQIARLSANYQIDKKVETIDNLTIINYQRKEIIKIQQRSIISLIIAIILVLMLVLLLFIQFKKIKKAHIRLSQNTLELNRKNREIAELRKKRDLQRKVVYNELKIKLEDLFENKKFYLKKELTLTRTARILKTNTSYLSALINKYYDCNFNQYVNKYRIQNACELLNNRNMDIYSIEGIADMAGFKSKSVFNQVFKEGTGVHPSVFRNATIVAD